jgi:hypothetical protein
MRTKVLILVLKHGMLEVKEIMFLMFENECTVKKKCFIFCHFFPEGRK